MSNLAKHIIAAVITLVFAIVFYINSLKLPREAASLPRILIGIIVLLTLGMLLEAVLKERKAKKASQEQPEEKEIIKHGRVFIFGLLIAIYITLIKPVGYFIVTPLFVIGALSYLKSTRFKAAVFVALGFTLFVYLLFVVFLELPIPLGPMS